VNRLHALLAEGRAVDAGALVRKVMADGAPAGDVYVCLIAPALHRIGDDWAAGLLGVADEHRATEIVAAIMTRLGDAFRRRGPARGTVVTTAAPGDLHSLGAAMAADFARAAGYEVHHLGGNLPLDELERFLRGVDCDVLCVSVTSDTGGEPDYAGVVETATRSGVRHVVFGGQAAHPDVDLLGSAHYVANLRDLGTYLQTRTAVVTSG
jgi:MerR family transcriptional regulator, light-induced transcriptional regulator